jgi:transcriptional regulator with XRE-family HTH domain
MKARKQYGLFLKNARIRQGLTQGELGEKLGYHAQFISNWERGTAEPPPRKFKRLARVLDISLQDLIAEEIQAHAAKLQSEINRGAR